LIRAAWRERNGGVDQGLALRTELATAMSSVGAEPFAGEPNETAFGRRLEEQIDLSAAA